VGQAELNEKSGCIFVSQKDAKFIE
jgi:hypothetical protein